MSPPTNLTDGQNKVSETKTLESPSASPSPTAVEIVVARSPNFAPMLSSEGEAFLLFRQGVSLYSSVRERMKRHKEMQTD